MRLGRFMIATQILVLLSSSHAFSADMVLASAYLNVRDKGQVLPPSEQNVSYPLPNHLIQKFGRQNQDHEFRAHLGLLDQNSEQVYYHSLFDQQSSLLGEILSYQMKTHFKTARTHLKEEAKRSPAAQSALTLTTLYLIYNGEPITAHLTDSTEFQAQAHGADRSGSLGLVSRNISLWNITSGIHYQIDPQSFATVTASVSKEIAPHLVASINQTRTLASTSGTPVNESTGQLGFNLNF